MLVSTTEPASVVVTSWPHESAHDREALLAHTRDLAGPRPVPHRDDWPTLKICDDDSETGTSAAYLLSNPRTGRVLSLEVSIDVPDFGHPRWRTFDRLVGQLRWDEDQDEEATREAHR